MSRDQPILSVIGKFPIKGIERSCQNTLKVDFQFSRVNYSRVLLYIKSIIGGFSVVFFFGYRLYVSHSAYLLKHFGRPHKPIIQCNSGKPFQKIGFISFFWRWIDLVALASTRSRIANGSICANRATPTIKDAGGVFCKKWTHLFIMILCSLNNMENWEERKKKEFWLNNLGNWPENEKNGEFL